MPEPRLATIVIDNYNYGRFLTDAIDSALAQTYPNTEIIVVDDGSTDESREVIASYGGRIKALFKQNGGQASAFNAGFEASTGEVILFLDADDMLLSTALEKAIPHFAEDRVVKVHWPLSVVDEHGNPTGHIWPQGELARGDLRKNAFLYGPTNCLSAPGCGNAWSRSFLERLFPLPEHVYRNGCDTFLFEAAPFYGTLAVVHEPQTLYRQHAWNDHRSFDVDAKIARELSFYDHYAQHLASYAKAVGIDVDLAVWRDHSWWHRHKQLLDEVSRLPQRGAPIVLVDGATLEVGEFAGHPCLPFTERNGVYFGPPADDDAAIAEIESQRRAGSRYVVVAWPAFWWMECYERFARYLRSNYRTLVENECTLIFDLETARAA